MDAGFWAARFRLGPGSGTARGDELPNEVGRSYRTSGWDDDGPAGTSGRRAATDHGGARSRGGGPAGSSADEQ